MTVAHLAQLNPEQRRAVEYGGPDFGAAGPLLILAGAGSGKTNTLAHRVAYLIVNGADPRRILLMTFSRRAAAEMSRRVERIVGSVPGYGAAAAGGGSRTPYLRRANHVRAWNGGSQRTGSGQRL